MNRIWTRAIAAAGVLALTGGTALVSALPASAAGVPANFSYGARATGTFFVAALAQAHDQAGEHVVQLSHFNFATLVTGGEVIDTATPTGASSAVAKVNVHGVGQVSGLTARIASSSCSNNDGDSTGQTTITGGLVGMGGFGEPIDTNPTVDEEIDLPGNVTVFLNDQESTNRELTVHAMLIEMPGETITVGTSVCMNNDS
jgi:hypothetical protein